MGGLFVLHIIMPFTINNVPCSNYVGGYSPYIILLFYNNNVSKKGIFLIRVAN